MKLDAEKIDRAVLALLYLGLHEEWRAWKGFDWDALSRLHEKGLISDPVRKTKSVAFTETGRAEARRLLIELFAVSE
jgi:DNA-binding PadR family transcriptional regulator